jgi:TusA-related sulfurtransferase
MTQSIEADCVLDVTQATCPMTYVRVRLALDRLRSGAVLMVRLRGADAELNVPRTAEQQGHAVLARVRAADGALELRLRRK